MAHTSQRERRDGSRWNRNSKTLLRSALETMMSVYMGKMLTEEAHPSDSPSSPFETV
jgi:hypothetical protein